MLIQILLVPLSLSLSLFLVSSFSLTQALEPDHGYPLRLVVPGQIGGRSVKWVKKIIVSDKESQHHLHFWVSSRL